MSKLDSVAHLLGGGVGGTVGAIVTCPLEVVKTRLQSSVATFDYRSASSTCPLSSTTGVCHQMKHVYVSAPPSTFHHRVLINSSNLRHGPHLVTAAQDNFLTTTTVQTADMRLSSSRIGIWKCLRYIIEMEGATGLFKGLGPNLVGVAPYRAIYFCTYSNAKAFLNQHIRPDSPLVHMCSAICAGFSASTITNPIWFVKTRLQLDQRKNGQSTTLQCVRNIYANTGVKGFYKGITASYMGISETVIHFVVYEAIKARLRDWRNVDPYSDAKTIRDFMEYMGAGAISKTIASCLAYPHEVARTRLRQEGNKYRAFWQTLILVFHEEGGRGLYRGLCTQLLRQIPNTAVMMATYEAVVYLLSRSNSSSTYINV